MLADFLSVRTTELDSRAKRHLEHKPVAARGHSDRAATPPITVNVGKNLFCQYRNGGFDRVVFGAGETGEAIVQL